MNASDQKRLGELHPRLRSIVAGILEHVNAPGKLPAGLELHIHTGYRSPEAQAKAVAAGNSRLKRSKHNRRPALACDLVWKVGGRWSWDPGLPWWLVGYWAEELGGRWGGRWGTPQAARKVRARDDMALGWDCPHVEIPG